MAFLTIRFNTKYALRFMQARSFRLHQIKQMLAEYEPHVIYNIDEEKHVAEITFSDTFPDELNKEISERISNYFTIARNKVDSYYDIAMEMKYENGEELIFPSRLC
jgi:hypothetical protein|nr:MAG TPA: hypothetical protein [Caudoviricetes sp.]DAO09466.1 MAG TPA: hypothetical protein [Caudoviricetes sp.]